ncbi:hypothetical protein [Sphingomonas bacterium]|uniref:hypothetical protein n=1 Tax=Sphingomonas bacterium TaxID=1895847 RepID=UPI0026056279|nr:hypothetical protein [Sphingomonas bacterium]MDB5679985.1 uncharacterized protein [Sphingomonas bacterium]
MSHRTIHDFVDSAFPYSTVPVDKENSLTDFSFNYPGYEDWANGKKFNPAGKLKEVFPMWPADLFAVTSAILEQSAAYQRLAEAIHPVGSTPTSVDWANVLDPSKSPPSDDLFGVRLPYRLLLRFIGALWSQGALFVSGLCREDIFVGEEAITDLHDKRAQAAREFLRLRHHREIRDRDLRTAEEEIYQFVIDRLHLEKSPDTPSAKRRTNLLIPNSTSELSYKRILLHHKKFMGSGKTKIDLKQHYSSRETIDAIYSYCHIIWANHYIQWHWNVLRESERPISLAISHSKPDPDDQSWWRAATRLLIIADEAGKSMGFSLNPELELSSNADTPLPKFNPDNPLQAGADCRTIWEHYQSGLDARLLKQDQTRPLRFARTLTQCFEEDLGSVLPKAHVPSNGCTIRSLSHNFALLPPKGRVRARWARQPAPEERTTYNILIVPYPYRIKSQYVLPIESGDDRSDWGFFQVSPGWIYGTANEPELIALKPDEKLDRQMAVWHFIKGLMDEQADGTIDAVVLPESALDWETFSIVQKAMLEHYPSIEMFVCGLTSAPVGTQVLPGNFVATYTRSANAVDKTGGRIWTMFHHRPKHHRWKLDAAQLGRYALASRLRPDKLWWENIPLPPREMLFAEFAPGSIVTTLICEDLARIEPCQVALRSVGPNLVLVLLMDSAQITTRWPYQYAGVLTDDPGSSVLTLTSFGLIHRSNLSEDRSSRQISLWREPQSGAPREISLPKGYHAQLLSIRKENCPERTLDGRDDNNDSAIIWKFAGLVPVKAAADVVIPGGGPDD